MNSKDKSFTLRKFYKFNTPELLLTNVSTTLTQTSKKDLIFYQELNFIIQALLLNKVLIGIMG